MAETAPSSPPIAGPTGSGGSVTIAQRGHDQQVRYDERTGHDRDRRGACDRARRERESPHRRHQRLERPASFAVGR